MFIKYLIQGGWVMLLILLASIIALAVFIERMFYLSKVNSAFDSGKDA